MKLEQIKKLVEKEMKVDLEKISRKRHFVYSRAVYFKLARIHTYETFHTIGQTVRKDHSSVVHGIKIFNDIILYYKDEYFIAYSKLNRYIRRQNKTRKRDLEPESYYRDKYATYLLKYRELLNKAKEWGLVN